MLVVRAPPGPAQDPHLGVPVNNPHLGRLAVMTVASAALIASTAACSTSTPPSTPNPPPANPTSDVTPSIEVPAHATWSIPNTPVEATPPIPPIPPIPDCAPDPTHSVYPCWFEGALITDRPLPSRFDGAVELIETFEDGSIINHTTGWRGCPTSNPTALCHD